MVASHGSCITSLIICMEGSAEENINQFNEPDSPLELLHEEKNKDGKNIYTLIFKELEVPENRKDFFYLGLVTDSRYEEFTQPGEFLEPVRTELGYEIGSVISYFGPRDPYLIPYFEGLFEFLDKKEIPYSAVGPNESGADKLTIGSNSKIDKKVSLAPLSTILGFSE